ncbi:PMEPA1 isoform 6, partial [Pan troglodytes]
MHRLMGVNSTAAAAAGQPNVSCTCNCKRSLFQSMEISCHGFSVCKSHQHQEWKSLCWSLRSPGGATSITGFGSMKVTNPAMNLPECQWLRIQKAELEFVQIIIIVVVMMVMVVVITCLLSHYKLSARSFISRHSQGRRREDALSSEGCLWPSESTVSGNGIPEPQVYAPPRPTDRLAVPPFAQRDRFHRFQPTYPYLQHEIDLPPTISLSDGEEPPPYQGPCTLQLR